MESKFKPTELVTFTQSEEGKYAQSDKGRIVKIHEAPNPELPEVTEYFYDVTVHGNLIEYVPENNLEHALSTTEAQVDEILREDEKNKKFKDSDIRVGGSKKEKRAFEGLIQGKDLEAIEKDAINAKKWINKNRVYPILNIATEIDKGVSGGTAFLKQKMRDTCGAMPPDTVDARKYYVEFIGYAVNKVADVLTIDEFQTVAKEIYNMSLEKVITILNPHLENEVKREIEDMKELKEKLLLKEDSMRNVDYKFHEKYGYRWRDEIITDEEDNQKRDEYFSYEKLKTILRNYEHHSVTPLVAVALKNIGIKDFHRVRFGILEHIFGKKFAKYLYTQGGEYTEQAKGYDGMSEEVSKTSIEKQTSSLIKRIEKIKNFNSYFSDASISEIPFRERLAKADEIDTAGGVFNWGFHKSQFEGAKGETYVYYRKAKLNAEWFDIYIQQTLRTLVSKDTLGELEKRVTEIKEKYRVRDNDYSWAEGKKKGSFGERTDLIINSGIPLSYIKRDGGIEITNNDLNSDEKVKSFYKNVLGITRIEFGNYLPDKEREQHTKHFAGALIDMAEMLNWDVKALVGLGNLGIKFASSGHGKAMAHYESDRKAINLTRGSGDGTVCHETAHYIDNMIAELYPQDRVTEKRHAVFSSHTNYMGGGQNVSNRAVYDAFNDVMMFIRRGVIDNVPDAIELKKLHDAFLEGKSIKVEIEANKQDYYIAQKTIEEWEQDKKNVEAYLDFESYINSKRMSKYLGGVVNHFKLPKYEFTFYLKEKNSRSRYGTTAFYSHSKNMSSAYWTYSWELFARANETFFYDKLAKLNRANNYLVAGSYFERGEGIYPQGIEREIIFVLMDKLYKTIKENHEIPDFVAFREKRADEYVNIDLKKQGQDAEIVVDAETKQVIDSTNPTVITDELDNLKQQLIRLHQSLLLNLHDKKARGGEIVNLFDKLKKAI